jgi:hypothetical protein
MATDRSVGSALLHSPLPLIAAGIGLSLYLTTRKRPLLSQRDIDAISKKLRRTARSASKVANRQYRATRDTLADRGEELLDQASDTFDDVQHRARKYGNQGLSRLKTELAKDRSVALSTLGVVLGTLGSILSARRSRRMFH